MIRILIISLLLNFSCATVSLFQPWETMYVQEGQEKDSFIKKLKESKSQYVVEKKSKDMYEIKYRVIE